MHGCANWCHETSLTLSIDNWLNAVCHCQCHFPHSTLHFYHPDMHFCESRLSIHHKLPYKQHSLQPHSEEESLPPLSALLVLMRTKEWCHPEESNMVSKCKHTEEDGQQTNAGQYPFITLLFYIQENANTALTASKSIIHLPSCLREHAPFIGKTNWCTNVPEDSNHLACLAKAMLWMTFFAFRENSSVVHTQTQQ